MGNEVPKCCKEEEAEVPNVEKLEDEHTALSRRHQSPSGNRDFVRSRVWYGKSSVMVELPCGKSSLADSRRIIVEQLRECGFEMPSADSEASKLAFKYKDQTIGDWLMLSSLALKDFSTQDLKVIEIAVVSGEVPLQADGSCSSPTMRPKTRPDEAMPAPKPKNQSENEKVWAIVESAMTALSDGDKKEEPVAALAQAFEQANINMHVRLHPFVDVHTFA